MQSDSETQLDTEDEPAFSHIPVLSREVIEGLAVHPGGRYLDATVGGGGHSRLILEAAPDAQLTAMDQDEDALIAAKKQLGSLAIAYNSLRAILPFTDFLQALSLVLSPIWGLALTISIQRNEVLVFALALL